MNTLYLCPVCGYDKLELPVKDNYSHNICPSCRTHLGWTDYSETMSFAEMQLLLREEWIKQGMPWRSKVDPIPSSWNPQNQLDNLLEYLKNKSE
jgi:Zn-finger nucleic acid-binding protein